MYENGQGVKKDTEEALRQYRLAGEHGSMQAQAALVKSTNLGKRQG